MNLEFLKYLPSHRFVPIDQSRGDRIPMIKYTQGCLSWDDAMAFSTKTDNFAIAVKTGSTAIAIDLDSQEAIDWFHQFIGCEPDTLTTSSGKPGRRVYWFRLDMGLPEEVNFELYPKAEFKYGRLQHVWGQHWKSGRYQVDNLAPIATLPSNVWELAFERIQARQEAKEIRKSRQPNGEFAREIKFLKQCLPKLDRKKWDEEILGSRDKWRNFILSLKYMGDTDELYQLARDYSWNDCSEDDLDAVWETEPHSITEATAMGLLKEAGFALPARPKPPGYTELTRDRVRLDSEKGYYFREGKHWEFLGWNITKLKVFTGDYLLERRSSDDTKNVLKLIHDEEVRWLRLPIPDDTGLVGFRNGVLDSEAGKFRGWRDNDFVTRYHDVDYSPYEDDPELFLRFLHQMFKDVAEDAIPVIRAFLSCLIRGDTRHQTFLAIVGQGGSGKSVLVSLFEAIAGRGNYVSTWLKSLQSPHGTEPLVGKSLITIKEVERAERTSDLPTLKSLVGEDEIQVNPKGKPAYSTRIRANLVVLSNTYLDFKDDGGSISRRIVQLPVLQTENDVLARGIDYDLSTKLKAEIPNIIAWALRAENPHSTLKIARSSDALQQALKAFKLDADPVAEVVDTLLTFEVGKSSQARVIYDAVREAVAVTNPSKSAPSDKAILQVIKTVGRSYGVEVEATRTKSSRLIRGVDLATNPSSRHNIL